MLLASACSPTRSPGVDDVPLETEEIGGAIDAELSTEDDRRGPRWVDSGRVLPAGFPADLPLAAGLTVAESGTTESRQSFVVFEASTASEQLASGWRALLVDEGWQVNGDESHFTVTKGDETVSAEVTPSGAGSRLRIVYP